VACWGFANLCAGGPGGGGYGLGCNGWLGLGWESAG